MSVGPIVLFLVWLSLAIYMLTLVTRFVVAFEEIARALQRAFPRSLDRS